MQPAQSPTPEPTGMWAPYEPAEIGEPLETLDKIGAFVLLDVVVREGVKTTYGPRDAVDLRVQTTDINVQRVFSGFSAGVVGMAKRVEEGNLPAVCRIIEQEAGRGKTRGLELVKLIPAGADVAAIANSLPVPIAPIIKQTEHDDIPY